ncbi:MAG: response regulator transcription factor [candidate division Zixibacteria bacterium]|nr:response regulator transcription factor [candidate division Zixibacteria bacterium]
MTNEFKARILLLEDDHNLGLIVEEHLRLNDFKVTLCKDGEEGWERFNSGSFDLCLVDIMMPKMDGFEFTRRVREHNDTIPIIFLTAKSLQEDKIKGFKIGCDDYITKPFSVEELLLRIQAVLKRVNKNINQPKQKLFEIGDYVFDSNKRILKGKSSENKLTSKESELLRLLCLNVNKTLERNHALREIWGDEGYFNSRSMDVFISKLRKYLKDDNRIEIVNIHGKGFRLLINL